MAYQHALKKTYLRAGVVLAFLAMLALSIGLSTAKALAEEDGGVPEEVDLAETSGLVETPVLEEEIDPAAGDEVEVASAADLKAVFNDLNANGGSKTVLLTASFSVSDTLKLEKGELTILGGGSKLTMAQYNGSILTKGSAVLNLGEEGYEGTLQIDSTNNSSDIIETAGTSTLNMYPKVTLGPSRGSADAGAVSVMGQSTFNMRGGTISQCISYPVAPVYVDENGTFNMYDGLITECSGGQGGAVALSGGQPIGGGSDDPVSAVFHMYGGTISNCQDKAYGSESIGGGAVCIFTDSPVAFIMDGGTITGCSASTEGFGYGGAIMVLNTDNGGKVQLNAGTITGNTAEYGGGLFVFRGNATIADGFGLYDNVATIGGDDIYNNDGSTDRALPDWFEIYYYYGILDRDAIYNTDGSVTLGTAPTSATLSCEHAVDDWYEDLEERWNAIDCSGDGEDHLETYTYTGSAYSEAFGLKAAHGALPVPTFQVTFDSQGGDAVQPQTVESGGAASRPADPNRNGYQFDGWYLNGEPYDFSTPVVEAITLVAHWTKEQTPPPGPTDPTNPTGPTNPTYPTYPTGTTTPPDTTRPPTPERPAPATGGAVTISGNENPLAEGSSWSLADLLLSLGTLGLSGGMLAGLRRKREEEGKDVRKRPAARVASLVPALGAVVLFLLTQDLSQPMAIFDSWTPVFAGTTVVNGILALVSRKKNGGGSGKGSGYVPLHALM